MKLRSSAESQLFSFPIGFLTGDFSPLIFPIRNETIRYCFLRIHRWRPTDQSSERETNIDFFLHLSVIDVCGTQYRSDQLLKTIVSNYKGTDFDILNLRNNNQIHKLDLRVLVLYSRHRINSTKFIVLDEINDRNIQVRYMVTANITIVSTLLICVSDNNSAQWQRKLTYSLVNVMVQSRINQYLIIGCR